MCATACTAAVGISRVAIANERWDVQVTLGTAVPGDVTAKVLACPFSETHRRALATPVQQRLPQFLVNEALGKGQPASEEDRQKWYLSFKGQTSVSLHFDSQRVRTLPPVAPVPPPLLLLQPYIPSSSSQ